MVQGNCTIGQNIVTIKIKSHGLGDSYFLYRYMSIDLHLYRYLDYKAEYDDYTYDTNSLTNYIEHFRHQQSSVFKVKL